MGKGDTSGDAAVRPRTGADSLDAALNPRAIAVIGASDNPNKIGGRPILYLSRFGYRGRVYPINPNRTHVQGHVAYPNIAAVPDVPDMAIIATPGGQVEQAVYDCAARGVRIAVVMASGFGETHDPAAIAAEHRMAVAARAAGMRLVGPNSQGLANFGSGAVASFSTMFLEVAPADGPVAIISQSGAMSVVPYGFLRARGIGVRHTHATGNDADVSLPELALAVVQDPDVRLLLLYMESIRDPAMLARAAEEARARDLPIVAVKAGRTSRGQAAARTHTAAIPNDDRVVDAFFRAHSIWRVNDVHALVEAAELYLKGWRPEGRRLVVVSNSGASCVMAADAVHDAGLELSNLSGETVNTIAAQLPAFATTTNPIDLTAALLTNGALLGSILPVLAADDAVDQLLVAVPVAGTGYDVPAFARAAADFSARTGKPVAVAAPQESVADVFRRAGVPTFLSETRAISALAQLTRHTELMRCRIPQLDLAPQVQLPRASSRFLSEAQSLECLAALGLPLAPFQLCHSSAEARAAFARFGGSVVLRASSPDIQRASSNGLVRLGLRTEEEVEHAFAELEALICQSGHPHDGIIVMPMKQGKELQLVTRFDPLFGPVLFIDDAASNNGLEHAACLIGPVDARSVHETLAARLSAPKWNGFHGAQHRALERVSAAAATLYRFAVANAARIASIRLAPVLVCPDGDLAVLGACVEQRAGNEQETVARPATPAGH